MSQCDRQDLGEWDGESYEAICKRKNSRIAQLERTNAALLGALRETLPYVNGRSTLQVTIRDRVRAAIAEAESQKENGNES